MKIAVLGGSAPQPESPAYTFAYQIGQRLAQARYQVLTGGYTGSMEAVSKGAAEAGGHVIGFVCQEVERWKAVKPNPWVHETWPCETMQALFNQLIRAGDAVVALPGGVCTLLEICLTWNQLIIQAMPPKPLILVGSGWRNVIDTFRRESGTLVVNAFFDLLAFAEESEQILKLLSDE
jgi:hypothetical protein